MLELTIAKNHHILSLTAKKHYTLMKSLLSPESSKTFQTHLGRLVFAWLSLASLHRQSESSARAQHTMNLTLVPGLRIRIRMDPPILEPLDPDPHFFADPDPGYLFWG